MEILGDRPGDISGEVAAGQQRGPRDAVAVVIKQLWYERSGKAVKQIAALYVARHLERRISRNESLSLRDVFAAVQTRTVMKCAIAALRFGVSAESSFIHRVAKTSNGPSPSSRPLLK